MKEHAKLSILFLFLLTISGTVFGAANGLSSMALCGDTLPPMYKPTALANVPDSLRPPTRLVWQGEKGVFLTDRQEQVTLSKLQWKEQYKNDAVTMYFVALALQDRVKDLEIQNTECRAALRETENEALDKNQKFIDVSKALNDEKAANAELRDQRFILQRRLNKSIVINVGLGVGLGVATWYIITH